jgi:hypothetical protein
MSDELRDRLVGCISPWCQEYVWGEKLAGAVLAEIEQAGFSVIERDVLARVAHAAGFARSEFGVDACRLEPGDVHAALTAAKRP